MCHVRRLNANCKEVRVSIFVSAPFGINAKPAAATLANDDDGVQDKEGRRLPSFGQFFLFENGEASDAPFDTFWPFEREKMSV